EDSRDVVYRNWHKARGPVADDRNEARISADDRGQERNKTVAGAENDGGTEDRPILAGFADRPLAGGLGPAVFRRRVERTSHGAHVKKTPDAGALHRGHDVLRRLPVYTVEGLISLFVDDADQVDHRIATGRGRGERVDISHIAGPRLDAS